MGRRFLSRAHHPRASAIALSIGLLSLLLDPTKFGCVSSASVARAESATSTTTAPSEVAQDDDLATLQKRFESVAARVSPAVVAISASVTADPSPAALRADEMNPDKLQAFLSKTTRMVGTGFIISSDGYVLTNDHVIDEAEQLWITTDDKKVYPALVLGSDPRADLAVLKIPAKDLPAVHFGDGTKVRRGQWSIAIGNPFGLSADGEMCLSVGVVSAVNRSLPKLSDKENRLYANLIQTTAQINPGNSGGPLFDLDGNVVGLNTAVIMPQKNASGIGFAMPIDAHLLSLVEDLKQGKEIVYGYLGVIVSTPTDREHRALGLPEGIAGVRVDSIQSDSPAAGGKLHEGDVLTAIDGHDITDGDAFVQLIGNSPTTRPVQIDLLRDGKATSVSLTLHKRPLPVAAVTRENQRLRWGGMILGPMPSTGATTAGLMVFGIDPTSPFTKFGVHEGSVIKTVAGKPVTGVTELQSIINDTPIEQCDLGLADLATAVVSIGH
jgi:S1-C subfamily serine protease